VGGYHPSIHTPAMTDFDPNAAAEELPFDRRVAFDPAQDFEQFLKSVPAKWVVYLLADEHDQPVQLLCVKNLRYSLKRRLGGDEMVGPTRRVNYRDLVRHIHWRRVDSSFEADWLYYEAARKVFPQTYQGMVGFRPAWFIHFDPDAMFPRYQKTIRLNASAGVFIGPLEDKHAAARLMHLMEDAFDLCRYYNILVQSPNALACPYKEMGKCPAPCDGSISLPQYRRLIEWSGQVLVDPADFLRDQTRRMEQAAAALRFETAAKIKTYIQQLSVLGKGAFRHAGKLQDFQYLSFQRGPRAGTVKVLLITPGQIEEILGLIDESFKPADVMRLALENAADRNAPIQADGTERIGIVSHHLFSPKQTQGVFLPLKHLDEKSIAKAYRDLQKQKIQEETADEGVIKELQAL
jgi:excinuclease UvrABC nuclease subunit